MITRLRYLKDVLAGQVISCYVSSDGSYYKYIRVVENDSGILYGVNRDTKQHVNIEWGSGVHDILLLRKEIRIKKPRPRKSINILSSVPTQVF